MSAWWSSNTTSAGGHNRTVTRLEHETFKGLLPPETCRPVYSRSSAITAVGLVH